MSLQLADKWQQIMVLARQAYPNLHDPYYVPAWLEVYGSKCVCSQCSDAGEKCESQEGQIRCRRCSTALECSREASALYNCELFERWQDLDTQTDQISLAIARIREEKNDEQKTKKGHQNTAEDEGEVTVRVKEEGDDGEDGEQIRDDLALLVRSAFRKVQTTYFAKAWLQLWGATTPCLQCSKAGEECRSRATRVNCRRCTPAMECSRETTAVYNAIMDHKTIKPAHVARAMKRMREEVDMEGVEAKKRMRQELEDWESYGTTAPLRRSRRLAAQPSRGSIHSDHEEVDLDESVTVSNYKQGGIKSKRQGRPRKQQ